MPIIRYEFSGGPMDGQAETEEGYRTWDNEGYILEVLIDGRYLYRSNGPMDAVESVVALDYVGIQAPSDDMSRFYAESWSSVSAPE